MERKTAIIIGAGPAGLTAAYELLKRTNIKPIIFETENQVGGIAKTINYKGNRIDIGGHRFFSKSKRVTDWWLNIDKKMLIRKRTSSIYFLRRFFDYPLQLSFTTLKNLGALRASKIIVSYIVGVITPKKNAQNLEDFFINRFGKELYKTFFKDYTEKVWGVPCNEIPAEWGAQRIKGFSIAKAIGHIFNKKKCTETTLIDQFLYPKFGPGQLWEEVAKQVITMGGEIYKNAKVINLKNSRNKILNITAEIDGNKRIFSGDYFFSTMPIKDLISGLTIKPPEEIFQIATNLQYRDFITIGVLLKKLKTAAVAKNNWVYIQEPDVRLGRLQIFNNWSRFLVKNPKTIWLGLEYFCNVGDDLWSMSDKKFTEFAIKELVDLDIVEAKDVLDSIIIHVQKAYPAYFGTYKDLALVKNYLERYNNLFLIGRNGMHRYNNMDHSMLAAMIAVDNIVENIKDHNNIWAVNTGE